MKLFLLMGSCTTDTISQISRSLPKHVLLTEWSDSPNHMQQTEWPHSRNHVQLTEWENLPIMCQLLELLPYNESDIERR